MLLAVGVVGIVVFCMVMVFVASVVVKRWRTRRRCGIQWSAVEAFAEKGEGCLVVDHAYGDSIGLFGVVVWWCPTRILAQSDVLATIAAEGALADCPKVLRDATALSERFPKIQVLENSAIRLK
jgi:hypothetical protein